MEKVYQLFWKQENKNDPQYARNYVYKAYNKFVQHMKNPIETIKSIINKVKYCNLKPQYRPIVWQIFLNILPYNESKEWKNIIDDFRSNYYNYKSTYINENIKKFILCNEEKGSEKYEKAKKDISQQDLEILSLIKLDIKRTYQEIKLFISFVIYLSFKYK